MPEFPAIVREEIAPLGLGKDRELKVVGELAEQIAEVYESVLEEESGLSEDAAVAETFRRIPPWDELRRDILGAESALIRMTQTGKEPSAPTRESLRRFGRDWGLLFDLRLSLRRLRSTPAFTATTVLTLALCLAANAAILTLVDRVLLHPLEIPDPDQFVLIANQFPNTGVGGRGAQTAPVNYFDRVEGVTSLAEQGLFGPADRVLTFGNATEQVHGMETTPSLFPALRVAPALGRTFTPEEGEIGNEDRILLSDALWRERFAADPNILDTTIRVNGRPFIVVGVMPAGFTFFDAEARFWVPLVFPPRVRNAVANNWYHVGRMAPGVTIDQVQTEVDAVNAAFMERQPNLALLLRGAGFHSTVEPLETFLIGDLGRVIYLLWGGAAAVLLIGALNIANLTLAETHRRRRDLFTRMAMGAGRGRLAAGLLFESLTMAGAGGILGLGLAVVALRTMGTLRLEHLPSPDTIGPGWPVAALAMGIALAAGAFIGIAPMRHLRRTDLSHGLHDESRTGTSGRGTGRLRRVLVTAEVALAFVLLVGAGLLLATFRNLLEVDPGFSVESVVTAGINLEGDRYRDGASALRFLDRALAAIRAVPGVTAAGATTSIPLRETLRGASPISISGGAAAQIAIPEETPDDEEPSLVTPTWVTITSGFFDALDAPILGGRDFEDRDHQSDNPVAIIDETMAQAYWPGENPIGKRMFLLGVRNIGRNQNTRWLTVVGVVPELLLEDLSGRENQAGAFYAPWSEVNADAFPLTYGFVIQTTDVTSVMRTVNIELRRLDPEMALFDVQTMTERRAGSLGRQRLAMSLAGAFGGVALFLSALGVYGVLSYLVSQRMREFGIRIALGSTSGGILRLVLGEGFVLVGAGLAIGLGAAYALRNTIASQVFGVEPGDPLLIAGATAVLVAVALAAAFSPARRATRVDPLIVLNDQ